MYHRGIALLELLIGLAIVAVIAIGVFYLGGFHSVTKDAPLPTGVASPSQIIQYASATVQQYNAAQQKTAPSQ